MGSRSGKQLLSREDWIRAALHAVGDGGVKAVAVDRLARVVGATRGSFYWHFADRDELIDAALEQWERENTTELIPVVQAVADPVERLRVLFREVYEQEVDAVEVALAAAPDEPRVAAVFARVTGTRLEFLRGIFHELGLPPEQVDDRAWLAYAFYIGHHQLARNADVRTSRPEGLDRVVELLTAP